MLRIGTLTTLSINLTPYDAYREGLVKQIEVAGFEESAGMSRAFVEVKSLQSQRSRVTARLAVHKTAEERRGETYHAYRQGW